MVPKPAGFPASSAPNVRYYEEFARDYGLFFSDLQASMEQEGKWLDALFRPDGVHTILDACCGTGRQAIPLARRGYGVTAVDPCRAMLQEARRLAREAGVELPLIPAAFADLPAAVPGTFDAVIALGNGLCHQERRDDIIRSLQAMRACCRHDGLCLIGIKDFDAVRRDRPRFLQRGTRDQGAERTVLFEIWTYEDPVLVSTAYAVTYRRGTLTTRRAETHEYMLGAEEIADVARLAGFNSVERLEHPCEAVYALR